MEMLYHYLWKNRVFGVDLTLNDGRRLEIINPGIHNRDAGPDFSSAKVKINDTEWAGNVEIHVKASDWYRHGHHTDPAYQNVLLHVVGVDDAQIQLADGRILPQVNVVMSPQFLHIYASLSKGIDNVRCAAHIRSIPKIATNDWLESLGIERLISKAGRISQTYWQFGCDWEQTLFITLARALGFGLNGVPFEMMAKSLPLKYLYRHADDPLQTAALLFGQAGLLDPTANIFDEYHSRLCREYAFLAKKYELKPIRAGLWKYARTRPQNFPHRRLAILAAAIQPGFSLTDHLLDAKGDIEELRSFFSWEAPRYWTLHSDFGMTGTTSYPRKLSKASVDLLLINFAAPFYYAYGALQGNPDIGEWGVNIQNALPAEKNSIISQWEASSLKARDAFQSQALIHLRKEYCDRSRCLDCRFGHRVLQNFSN